MILAMLIPVELRLLIQKRRTGWAPVCADRQWQRSGVQMRECTGRLVEHVHFLRASSSSVSKPCHPTIRCDDKRFGQVPVGFLGRRPLADSITEFLK